MKLKIFLILIVLTSINSLWNTQESYCQNKLETVQQEKLDLDTVGIALLKGLEYKELYFNEVILNDILLEEILLKDTLLIHKDDIIIELSRQIVKQEIIYRNDWAVIGVVSGLTGVIAVVLTILAIR